MLTGARSALRQAVVDFEKVDPKSADDVAAIERAVIAAHYTLDRYRMIRPKAHIPAEILADLRTLSRSSLHSLQVAAMSGNRVWKPAERIEFDAVLDTIMKQAQGNAHYWTTRAQAYAALGDTKQAAACQAKALTLR